MNSRCFYPVWVDYFLLGNGKRGSVLDKEYKPRIKNHCSQLVSEYVLYVLKQDRICSDHVFGK